MAQPEAKRSRLTERQQLAMLLKDSDEEDEEAAEEEDEEDSEEEEGPEVPGMVTDMGSAKRWWEGTEGFDFAAARKKQSEEEGMRVEGDPGGYVGKIVKRSFGRGIVSFGKIVGWFPPEEEGDEPLYHVLHGDGDEEDLDPSEARDGVRWAERDSADDGKRKKTTKRKAKGGGGGDDDDDDEGIFDSEDEGDSDGGGGGGGGGDDDDDDDEAAAEAAGLGRRAAAGIGVLPSSSLSAARRAQREANEAAASARAAHIAALLRKPPRYSAPAAGCGEAALRGVGFIYHLSRDDANLAKFGSDLIQTLYDVSAVAPEPVRRAALLRVEPCALKWKARFPALRTLCEDPAQGARPDEVVDAVMGLYALERVGLEHSMKAEVAAYLKAAHGGAAARFPAAHYVHGLDLGRVRSLLEPAHAPDRFTALTSALNTAYFATKVGVTLGGPAGTAPTVTLESALAHLRCLRPYQLPPGAGSLSHEDWVDQITLVFNVVHVCSNFGELALPPHLFPHEAAFLAHPKNMKYALQRKDVHIVGEVVHCLRVLGVVLPDTGEPGQPPVTDDDDDDEGSRGASRGAWRGAPSAEAGAAAVRVCREGLSFLLATQRTKDGGWPTRDGDDEPYSKYHAAMCATMALYAPCFRGLGPGHVPLLRLLTKWLKQDAALDQSNGGKAAAAAAKGGARWAAPAGTLTAVEELYANQGLGLHGGGGGRGGQGAAKARGGDGSNGASFVFQDAAAFRGWGEARLAGLLQWRAATALTNTLAEHGRSGTGGTGGTGGSGSGAEAALQRRLKKKAGGVDRGLSAAGRSSAASRGRALALAQQTPRPRLTTPPPLTSSNAAAAAAATPPASKAAAAAAPASSSPSLSSDATEPEATRAAEAALGGGEEAAEPVAEAPTSEPGPGAAESPPAAMEEDEVGLENSDDEKDEPLSPSGGAIDDLL